MGVTKYRTAYTCAPCWNIVKTSRWWCLSFNRISRKISRKRRISEGENWWRGDTSSYSPCTSTHSAVRAVYTVRAVRCFVTSLIDTCSGSPATEAVMWTALHTPQHCSGGRSSIHLHPRWCWLHRRVSIVASQWPDRNLITIFLMWTGFKWYFCWFLVILVMQWGGI